MHNALMTDEAPKFRAEILRRARGWSQSRMAEFLNCDQATVSRLENGQAEPGPIARLLDYLETGELPAVPATKERAA